MAKPPKKKPGTPLPDSPAKTDPVAVNSPDVNRTDIAGIDTMRARVDQTLDLTPEGASDELTHQPSVTVSEIPSTRPLSLDDVLRSITWPADRSHLLMPLDPDGGLFISSDGRIYAHIESDGHFLVERQADGRYQIPFDFAPGSPGPFVSKIKDQPLWRLEKPDWLTPQSDVLPHVPTVPSPRTVNATKYLDPDLAARLSQAADSSDGIRYDKHRKTYVDTPDGTVMVSKNADGNYQQTFARERRPSGALLERIAGTKQWRLKTPHASGTQDTLRLDRRRPATETNPAPGPSKRLFLGDDADSATDTQALTQSLISSSDAALDPSFEQWRTWGKTTRAPLEMHIEIDNLHYPVVIQNINADTRLVYVKHPQFSPGLYDAFEHMLGTDPALQPKWAVKVDKKWCVLSKRVPFEMPLTNYISTHFKYLSTESTRSLARAMFNQANRSEVINGHGLAVLNQTFRFWADRKNNPVQRRELADPLTMLRKLPPPNADDLSLSMPSSLGEGLQRLDFDPGQFAQHWIDHAVLPTTPDLRSLFSAVLTQNGYLINETSPHLGENTLLFHREKINSVFVLTFPKVIGKQIQRKALPASHLNESALQIRMGGQQKDLATYIDEQKVVYLMGGIQKQTQQLTTLFIVREG
ncbi:hypothetical protein [Pseudomonas sp. NPDC087639]|uniref:hypothetical protein n=1 Tax=Pseudomonas sp. NPDC087639 TaxID=3364445 RepID=UPI00380432C7